MSFAEWQEQGFDLNSVVADPLFIDPAKGDYRVQPNSAALKLASKTSLWTIWASSSPSSEPRRKKDISVLTRRKLRFDRWSSVRITFEEWLSEKVPRFRPDSEDERSACNTDPDGAAPVVQTC